MLLVFPCPDTKLLAVFQQVLLLLCKQFMVDRLLKHEEKLRYNDNTDITHQHERKLPGLSLLLALLVLAAVDVSKNNGG